MIVQFFKLEIRLLVLIFKFCRVVASRAKRLLTDLLNPSDDDNDDD